MICERCGRDQAQHGKGPHVCSPGFVYLTGDDAIRAFTKSAEKKRSIPPMKAEPPAMTDKPQKLAGKMNRRESAMHMAGIYAGMIGGIWIVPLMDVVTTPILGPPPLDLRILCSVICFVLVVASAVIIVHRDQKHDAAIEQDEQP